MPDTATTSTICSTCHRPTTRYTKRLTAPGQWRVTCAVCAKPRHAGEGCTNPFGELVLDHVYNERGEKVRVTSLRQLHRAEKDYGFRSLVGHTDAANFDKPPASKQPDLLDTMTQTGGWLHPEIATAMIKDMRQSGELPPA